MHAGIASGFLWSRWPGKRSRHSRRILQWPITVARFWNISATKFKCNFVVIDVVHSGIKMTGSYFSEFRWDEKCCNSLHRYKDYRKTHPLPQYALMINFIPITQCSPKWYCDACRTARAWRKRMLQRCPVNRQLRVFFYKGSFGFWGMGRYEITAVPWSSPQRICRWNFKEFWQVSGSAVIDGSFHNRFEWAPFTNGVSAERGTSRPRHRWHRLVHRGLRLKQQNDYKGYIECAVCKTVCKTITCFYLQMFIWYKVCGVSHKQLTRSWDMQLYQYCVIFLTLCACLIPLKASLIPWYPGCLDAWEQTPTRTHFTKGWWSHN